MRRFLQTVLRNQSVLYCSLLKEWIINGTEGLEACDNTLSVSLQLEKLKTLPAYHARKDENV